MLLISTLIAVTSIWVLHTSLGTIWPQFTELDATSKLITFIFQGVMPMVTDCQHSYSPSVQGRRNFLRWMSHFTNVADSLIHPALQFARTADIGITLADNYEMILRIYWDSRSVDAHLKDININTKKQLRPVLVWFHGGGWISGDIHQDDTICKRFALANDMIVINVDYRLAPEFTYPVAVEDAHASLLWIKDHIADYGGDPGHISIAGESAGGHLAAAIVTKQLHANGNSSISKATEKDNSDAVRSGDVKSLLLVYPALDHSSSKYLSLSPMTGMLPVGHIQYMRTSFATPEKYSSLSDDFIFAPLLAPDHILRDFPPTMIILAKHDVLAAEGLFYSKRLQDQGVSVLLKMYKKSIHIFFGRWPFLEGLLALEEAAAFLKEHHQQNE